MNAKYILVAIYLLLILSNLNGGEPARAVNITGTDSHFELKPKFVLGGEAIAFMVFDGNSYQPGLSDYRLVITDLNGKTLIYKSDVGVIDYRVCANGRQLKIIQASQAGQAVDYAPDDFDFTEWGIHRLDLQSGKMHLLEAAQGRPLRTAYEKLELPLNRVLNHTGYVISSPDQSRQVSIKLELLSQDRYLWTFIGKREKVLLVSEAWLSYTDDEWLPPIVWLSNDKFLTVGFVSNKDADLPQSWGVFSIIKIDLTQNKKSILYEKRSHRPIDKMAYNRNSDELFFQTSLGERGRGLYRLNLFSGDAEILYKTAGDLGAVHLDKYGSSLIFADFNDTNSDVIRLDLDKTSVRLASQ